MSTADSTTQIAPARMHEVSPSEVPMPSTLDSPPIALPEGMPYRLSVDDFYRMIELDFFARESRVGLWDGQVYEKMAKNPPHSASGILIITALARLLPPGWCFSAENPVTLAPDKAPLPDFAVLRGSGKDYSRRRADAADVGLIVELSDSSLRVDTGAKLAAYAKAGIPTYWVVNLVANVVQVYTTPVPEEGRYASAETFAPGSTIPLTLGAVPIGPIAASDLLRTPETAPPPDSHERSRRDVHRRCLADDPPDGNRPRHE